MILKGLNVVFTALTGQLAVQVLHVKQAEIFCPSGWLSSSFLKAGSALLKSISAIVASFLCRLLKSIHLRRYPPSSSLRRTSMYDSLLGTSGALHLNAFEQPLTPTSGGNL
jgi:hypothetical protein